jgi:hypothetical protein
MPNHITNELTAQKCILDSLKSAESELDFETVVPVPEILKGSPHMGITEWAKIAMGITNLSTLRSQRLDPVKAFEAGRYGDAASFLEQQNAIRAMSEGPFPINYTDDDFEQLLRCMRGLKEYGAASWCEWSIEHWGTKWNAYSITRTSDTTIRFDTAWSAPLKWLAKLIEKYPKEEISIRWADEDFGNNTGSLTVKPDGSIEGGPLVNDSPEAHKLAMELQYNNIVPDHMKPEPDGRYSYVEDDT